MPINRARRSRRTVPRHPLLLLLGFAVLLLGPVLDTIGAAQGLQITAQPTATPTETFDPPLQARPTSTPTPRVTEEPDTPDAPDEIPDDVQANPTTVPVTETVIDDIAPNPDPATLTLNKGVCDDSGFDPYTATGLDAFQDACFSPDGEFEFTVADGGGFSETAMTSLGSVQFTVPAGTIAITETIPAGFGEPAVFCWSNLLPTPAATPFIGNGPTWDVAEAEAVECWWFNVSEPEPQGHTIRVIKQVCPEGFAIPGDYWTLANGCTDRLDGIGFALATDGSTVDGVTDASGEFEWTDVDLGASGQVQLDEDIPGGYGEPVVWCVNFPQEAADAQDFDFFEVAAVDGLVTAMPDQTAPHIFACTYFNIIDQGAPGGLTTDNLQEGQAQLTNTVTIVKHRCPMGVVEDAEFEDYQEICTEDHDDIAFTLDHSGGSFPGLTADGEVQWTDVPISDFTIQETVPAGFVDPLVWCGLSPSIQLPTLMPSAGGLVTASFEGDAAEYICYAFNIPDTSPESRVVINKRICDSNVDLVLTDDNTINDIITACSELGEGIEFTLDHAEGSSTQAIDGDGDTYWDDVPPDPFTVTESIPAGYGEPVWYCFTNVYDEVGDLQTDVTPELVAAPGGVLSESIDEPYGEIFGCWVFNVPEEVEENSITILKWRCPEGSGPDESQAWYEANCLEEHDGVEFVVASDIGIAVMETAGGSVQFDGLPAGVVGIQETIPAGFGPPVVFCATDAGWAAYPAPTGHWELEFGDDGLDQGFGCHVYNIPGEPGSVTFLKWTCPPGYDLNAAGADPQADCSEATNGIDFQFGLSGIGEEAVLQTTGDLLPGGVVFDGLDPDTYKATELVPEGIAEVFVLECTGHVMGVLQPYPLQLGNVLEIELDAGEHLTCDWYNVPEPDGGKIIVTKYTCTTETFVSEVDCEIEEDGKTFDLLHWNVDDGVWEVIDTQVTDGVGQITWVELDAGEYGLDEQVGEWCHLTTLPVFGPGDYFSVLEGEETIVSVYNCDGEPGKPGDTPTKYPNTGAGPGQGPGTPTDLPAFAPLAGLLALLATRRTRRTASHSVGEDPRSSRPIPEDSMTPTLTRRKLAALLTLPLGGTALVRAGILAQADQPIEPIDGSPAAGTPTSLCLPATPGAGEVDECRRGPVPVSLRIAAIGVAAPVEILETVGGVMQQPRDEVHVAWYKQSARLGEVGNVWIAGHLNWWGHPEAVFFGLGTLRAGDQVVLQDAAETAWTYAVEWVRQESNLEPPAAEVLGMTGYEAVTLMTCGGQWDSTISEYDERTVARATRVPDAGTPEA